MKLIIKEANEMNKTQSQVKLIKECKKILNNIKIYNVLGFLKANTLQNKINKKLTENVGIEVTIPTNFKQDLIKHL